MVNLDTTEANFSKIITGNVGKSSIKYVQFAINFKPTPWKRPSGKGIRYDVQVADKAAFGILVTEALRNKGINLRAGMPLFPNQKVSIEIIFCCKAPGLIGTSDKIPNGDLDNMCKFVLDALQSQSLEKCIWNDDKQVCNLHAEKYCGIENKISVKLEVIE